jgi:hypothetical protein
MIEIIGKGAVIVAVFGWLLWMLWIILFSKCDIKTWSDYHGKESLEEDIEEIRSA